MLNKALRNRFVVKGFCMLVLLSMCFFAYPAEIFATELNSNSDRIIVSLGDSYSSGEGIEPFYDQDLPIVERVKSKDWLAHRSTKAWGGMLTLPGVDGTMAENRAGSAPNWFFVAASGAETKHLLDESQEKEFAKQQYKGVVELEPQLNVFEKLGEREADYVTLTIGGNDAKFTEIIACVVAGSTYLNFSELSDKINHTWTQFYSDDGIEEDLKHSYEVIAEKAGKQAHIIVAGYPKLLSAKGTLISKEEADLVNNAVSNFNNAIKKIVDNSVGINISFVSVEDEFEGREAYTDSETAYINEVMLSQSQDIKEYRAIGADSILTLPDLISAYSIHPNEAGAAAYAKCVQDEIDRLEGIAAMEYAKDFTIATYMEDGYLCDNYSIIIDGREHYTLFGLIGKDYNDEISVNKAEPVQMSLPEGTYLITVSDGNTTYSQRIKIVPDSNNNTLVFKTDFGKSNENSAESVENTSNVVNMSDERDIVLTLDTSGSMSGQPLEETKEASIKFVDTALAESANVGIVTYEGSAEKQSDFTRAKQTLNDAIDKLNSNGNTNIEDGLKTAYEMLEKGNAKKKIIVLMSDGEPNAGKVGEELISYANKIKDSGIIIYTLGFFENMSGSKTNAQILMEQIASEGCHYEVANAEDLIFFFDDIADQINGQRYIYVRIACPVDVTISYGGEILSSDKSNLNTRTEFGSLTFEESENDSSESADNRIKILRLKEGVDYNVQILGTDRGEMNYTIGFMDDEGEYSDFRTFEDIPVTNRTVVDTTATVDDKTILNIDNDGDGRYDVRMRAEANGLGEEVLIIPWRYIITIGLVLVGGIIAIYVLRRKYRKQRM